MRLSFDPDNATIQLEQTVCAECKMVFGLPPYLVAHLRTTGGNFYCPNGHQLHFGNSEVQKLQEKLNLEKKQRENVEKSLAAEQTKRAQAEASANYHRDSATRLSQELDSAKRSVRGQKAANTRIKNRVANGVCPCCNRTFQDLQRHMKTKHPGFAEGEQ